MVHHETTLQVLYDIVGSDDYWGGDEGINIGWIFRFISREQRGAHDGATRTSREVLRGAEGRARALRPEHKGNSAGTTASDPGARKQAGRAGEGGARARGPASRYRDGAFGDRRRVHARLPRLLISHRGLRTQSCPPSVGLGAHRLWYTAPDRGRSSRGGRQHLAEVGSQASPDDSRPPAEYRLVEGTA